MELDAKGSVTIDNKKYSLSFLSTVYEEVTDTKGKQSYAIMAKDEKGKEVSLTTSQLKGKKVSMTISKVKYTEDNIKGIKEVANDAEANAKAVEWTF